MHSDLTDAERALEQQRTQSIDHARQLTTALVEYLETINLALTLRVRIATNGRALDHHATIEINDPDAATIDVERATRALHSLMTLCTFNAWPGYMRAPVPGYMRAPAMSLGIGGYGTAGADRTDRGDDGTKREPRA